MVAPGSNIGGVRSVSKFHFGKELDADWSNRAFHSLRQSLAEFKLMASSWLEQRAWALDQPLQALGPTSPLAARIRREWAMLQPSREPDPAAEGFERVLGGRSQWSSSFQMVDGITIGLNATCGAITTLSIQGKHWATADSPLLMLQYQTLDLHVCACVCVCVVWVGACVVHACLHVSPSASSTRCSVET